MISGDFNSTGYSDIYAPSFFEPENESQFPKDGENTHAIILSSESLQENEWIELSVMARNVAVNGNESGLGLTGDQVGFGLAVSGIVKILQSGKIVIMMEFSMKRIFVLTKFLLMIKILMGVLMI